MSDESPANERPNFDVAEDDIIGGIVIMDLPDFLFLHCFAFIGKMELSFYSWCQSSFQSRV
jgi:hypothetical protein